MHDLLKKYSQLALIYGVIFGKDCELGTYSQLLIPIEGEHLCKKSVKFQKV